MPEGLWARKVTCGSNDGFTLEKKLGMSIEKIGTEIVVTHVKGFAKNAGQLSEVEDDIGMENYQG